MPKTRVAAIGPESKKDSLSNTGVMYINVDAFTKVSRDLARRRDAVMVVSGGVVHLHVCVGFGERKCVLWLVSEH